jgi:uncharacterized membrane protein
MRRLKLAMCWLLGLLFVAAGLNHFRAPDFYVLIMPPDLPWPRELVLVSGVFEVALGALLLVPRYRTAAAWGLVALLVAFVPVHVHMAAAPDQYPDYPPALIYARLPLQAALVAWAYWFTRRPAS